MPRRAGGGAHDAILPHHHARDGAQEPRAASRGHRGCQAAHHAGCRGDRSCIHRDRLQESRSCGWSSRGCRADGCPTEPARQRIRPNRRGRSTAETSSSGTGPDGRPLAASAPPASQSNPDATGALRRRICNELCAQHRQHQGSEHGELQGLFIRFPTIRRQLQKPLWARMPGDAPLLGRDSLRFVSTLHSNLTHYAFMRALRPWPMLQSQSVTSSMHGWSLARVTTELAE